MKKLILILFSCATMVQVQAQGMQTILPKQHNLTSVSTEKKVVTKELQERTSPALQGHPEFGVNPYNAPCTDCMELLDKRTESTRYFVGTDNAFYSQQAYGPLHFKDAQGLWRTIDARLKPTNIPHLFTAPNQTEPVKVDAGLGFTAISRAGGEFKFNRQLELLYTDDATTTSLGKANWSNYTVGDDGVKVIDAWPGVDIVIKVNRGQVESDFIVKQPLANSNGRYLLRDYMELPLNHHFAGITAGSPLVGGFSVVNANGEEAYKINNAFAYENSPTAENYDLWYNYSAQGGYVDIEIPAHWLNNPNRQYPVTIDPLVSATATLPVASITGSGYDAVCFQNGCTYNLPVAVPANCTVTDITYQFEYNAIGGCLRNQGAVKLTYGACQWPSTGIPSTCNLASAGLCNYNNVSVYSDLSGCVLPAQCASYSMNFGMEFFRCASSGGGCSATCIAASQPWAMTVKGYTVQTQTITGPQVICAGQSATIQITPQYGVPPYSVVWNPGGLSGTSVTVTPASTQLYTATVTDACGQTVSSTNTVNVTVNQVTNPGFSIGTANICAGVPFNIFGGGGGTTNGFDWVLTGSNQPTVNNSQNITALSYATAGTYTITLNYNNPANGCFNPSSQTITVNPIVTPTLAITANPTGPVCAGQCVTFTAVVTNGGTGTISWRKNGSLISSATLPAGTSLTYCNYVNGDIITADVTNNAACVSPATGTSNQIVMQVTPLIAPTVTITQSPANPVCPNTPVTFTATYTGGGPSPTFVWQAPSQLPSTSSNTFTSSTLTNGTQVAVTITSSLSPACVSPSTAFSNVLTVQVAGTTTPSVSITASPNTAICPGANVTFTATPTNGGPTPTYQWYNGAGNPIAGATSATYSTTGLVTGNDIFVVMTSSVPCPTTPTATSNHIAVTINPAPVPAVSIAASPAFPVCANSSVTFTPTPTNGGSTPTYQWYNGGTLLGSGATYTSSSLPNGASITAVMTSNAACANPTTATSNAIVVSLTAQVTPSVTITASPGNTICAGTSVTFTATPTNGGASPSYQWKKNGTNVGSNAATYTDAGLAQGDVITCVITSNAACANPTTATSNSITMTVNANVAPSVSIAANPSGAICAGQSVTFTATPTNGGTTPTYQWYNGVTPVGTGATYTTTGLVTGNDISVVMTTNVSCPTTPTATSNHISVTVNPVLVPSLTIAASPAFPVCATTSVTFTPTPTNGGTTPTYQWYNGGTLLGSGATYTSSSLPNGASITAVMTSNATCASPTTATSNAVVVSLTAQVTPSVAIAANPGSTICAGQSVTFTATPTNGGTTPVYQWKKNGSNVGSNSTTYTDGALVQGDVITCVITSNDPCANPLTGTSSSITMTVNPNVVPSVTIAANPSGAICAGQSVTFTATPTNGGSTPTYQWYNGVTPVGTGATYTTTGLTTGNDISVVMTTNVSCPTTPTATSNHISVTVNPVLVPSLTIAASPAFPVCATTSVTFTPTPTNGGTTPTYQWYNGGTLLGSGATYTSSSLPNGASITAVMTSNATCATPTTATSNAIIVSLTAQVTPAVSITANPGNTICAGTSVTFTATPTNGGTTPVYQWKKNGSNVGSNSTTYTDGALVQGDVITCVITSNDPCANPLTGTSSSITMTVNPNVTPSVTIASNPGSPVCQGQSVTFTATPTNGGSAPTYQWYVGANPVPGATTAVVTPPSLPAGTANVTVQMTSNAPCASPATVTSAILPMTVNALVAPSVSITVSPNTQVCAGSNLTFTATPTNAGANPTYQWYNGATPIAGATSSTYSATNLANGDNIKVVVTSNDPCPSPTTATSNTISAQIISQLIPSVGISASPASPICAGTSVTFTATPTNGGTTPTYQWKVNGVNAGTNSATFTTTTLANGDIVTVVLTSSEPCANPTTATSNQVTMTVNPVQTPTVSIAAAPASPICAGTSVTFTATPTNGGTTPTYQWLNNSVAIPGQTGATYTTTTLTSADNITVQMTSNIACPSPAQVTSNSINYTVNPVPVPSVTIAANPNTAICPGANVTFTATPTNGGASPTYEWFISNVSQGAPSASPTFSTTALTNGAQVKVVMTSNALCASPTTATSSVITVTVLTVTTPSVTVVQNPTGTICQGQNVTFTAIPTNGGPLPAYQWQVNGVNAGTNSATFSSTALNNGDVVTVILTSNQPCASPTTATSAPITMTVNPILVPTVTIADNPTGTICQGTAVTFTATPTNEGITPTYQWTVNNIAVGSNSPVYTSANPANGDVVKVTLTSSEQCAQPQSVTSSTITLSVISTVVPTVNILSGTTMPVCDNTAVTFTADTTGGGPAPTFQWYVNSTAQAGETAVTFNYTPANGDVISVNMTSNAQCANPTQATATLNAQTLPYLTPTISIVSSPATSVCLGQLVTFTATVTDAGTSPTIQWYVNGNMVGTNSTTYTSTGINPGDIIEAEVTSSYTCSTAPTAMSNQITLTFNPPITVTVSPTSTSACTYSKTLITATATGGDGGPYIYTWNDGTNGNTIDVSPDATTSYTVSVTDGCGTTPGTATATVNVDPTPIASFNFDPNDKITTLDDVFFENQSQQADWWIWNFGDGSLPVDTAQSPVHHYEYPGTYNISLFTTNLSGCADTLTITVEVKQEAIFYIPNAFTPNGDGKNELFRVYTTNISQPYTLVIYARDGEEVYNSENDATVPGAIYWTGQKHNSGKLLPEGVYIYYLYVHDAYLNKNSWSKRGHITMLTGQPE